nr:hypothetical protein [uncultured Bacteroides sp.]
MRKKSMQIKFEGQEHQIDANTLINVLIHYQTVITEANKELSGGAMTIELRVNAIEKGSFIIDVSVVESLLKQVFSKDSIEYLAALAAVIGGVYKAYKKLKGKPADNEEEKAAISIEDKKNKSTIIINKTIVNVYNQRSTREAISKSIEASDADPTVTGLSVNVDDKLTPITFKKEEFHDYIYSDFDSETLMPDEQTEVVETVLTIIGLNFELGSRWQFMFNGFKIPMIVKDGALMQKIDEGERFGKGDAIRVKLKIVKRYNHQYKAYENKSYKIVEFMEHILAPSQKELF